MGDCTIFNLRTSWKWVISFTSGSLPSARTHRIGAGFGEPRSRTTWWRS